MFVWLMVVKGTVQERGEVFLVASFIYFTYIVAGLIAPARSGSGNAGHGEAACSVGVFSHSAYLYMVIGVVGTTIAPWMQFYLQASVVEKGITARQYGPRGWT